MIYSPARVHVEAGGTASLSIQLPSGVTDYKSGLTFWAFDDEGSVAKFGPVTQSGSGITIAGSSVSGDVRTVNMSVSGIFSDVGYTVFVSFGTEVETTKIVYGGSAGFPIAKIVEAIYKLQVSAGSLRREAQRAMRSPEANDDQVLPMREIRKGRVLGFDAYGRPVSGMKHISELTDLLKFLKDFVGYEVLTREEYDAIAADGKLRGDVIYFIKGTKDFSVWLQELESKDAQHERVLEQLDERLVQTGDALNAAFAEAGAAIDTLEQKHDDEVSALNASVNDANVAAAKLNQAHSELKQSVAGIDSSLRNLEEKHAADDAERSREITKAENAISELSVDFDAMKQTLEGVPEVAERISQEVSDALEEQMRADFSDRMDAIEDASEREAQSRQASDDVILDRLDGIDQTNDVQDESIAQNAQAIADLREALSNLTDEQLAELFENVSISVGDIQNRVDALESKSGVATATFSGTSKLSTATVMDVNDGRVGHDSNGALRVASASRETNGTVYLPTHEWSALSNAAASLALLSKKANALSVECGATASDDNCNQYSFVGPLSSLGVTGACADLNTVTFYRRANNTPNGSTQVYLRLLKKVVGSDGNKTWQIASQSVNAVAFSAQTANGLPCGTFYMKRAAGVEPPTCDETVALVVVGAADAEVTTGLQFGCKVAPSTTGGVCTSAGLDSAITMDKGGLAVVPMLDITWTPYAPSFANLSALQDSVADQSNRIAANASSLKTKVNAIVGGMEADSSSADGSVYGWIGPISDLGVSGGLVNINTATFYRNGGSVGAGEVYFRILRKITDADGNKAWQVVSQSENAVDFNDQPENGAEVPTFNMRTQIGVEPLSSDETVALCFVLASDAESGACERRAYKMRTDVSGCLANLLVSAAINVERGGAAYSPIIRFTWTAASKDYGSVIAALEARVAALETASNG